MIENGSNLARRQSMLAVVAYGALLLGAVLLFFLIRSHGEVLVAPVRSDVRAAGGAVGGAGPDVFWHLLIAMVAVVVVGRLLGRLFNLIGQPPVIGEVVGGILLGPSLLGRIAPDIFAYVFPVEVASPLGVIAQLGILLYMFLVGLELNPDVVRGQLRATVAMSHASIVVPFVLGAALALYLYPRFSTSDTPFTNFSLFVGVAMSITAFPVLARILTDRRLIQTRLGTLALTCAAVGDVTAWCLLAFVVGVVQSKAASALVVAGLTLGFIAFMFAVVRPIIATRTCSADHTPSQGTIALTLCGVLIASLATEAIGVHAMFGAFLFGVVLPPDTSLARELRHSLESLVTILLLPAFFAFTGLRTEIGLVSGLYEWLICALIIGVATLGKFGGTFVAARTTGLDWQHAVGLGVLMNTRGLMELIVLNVGFDLGVISPTLFTMMVLMALATTVAAAPLLQLLVHEAHRKPGETLLRQRVFSRATAED